MSGHVGDFYLRGARHPTNMILDHDDDDDDDDNGYCSAEEMVASHQPPRYKPFSVSFSDGSLFDEC
jgi:hypothetical protein